MTPVISILSGHQIPAVIKLYTEKCNQCTSKVPHDKLKLFTEYFFSTFMAHFKLYQFVFTKPREDKTKHDELLIETVESPEPFSSGKPQNIWEYEQRLHELDKAAERRHQERELEVQCTKQNTEEALHKSVKNVENIEAPLTKEVYLIL